jgi:hypothetical protein
MATPKVHKSLHANDRKRALLRQEYQVPDDHAHCEDLQPALGVQTAEKETTPPIVPFEDDHLVLPLFLLRQQGHRTPYLLDLMASE